MLAGPIKKICILRALQLGDLLCAIPAVRALKKTYPEASIDLLGLPWALAFTRRFGHYFSGFRHFPGFPGLPEQPVNAPETVKFIQQMQGEGYDLAVQMQGSGSFVNPLTVLFDAKVAAGFYQAGDYKPEGMFCLYPDDVHEIERHLALMSFLGIESDGVDMEFPLTEADEQSLLDSGVLPDASFICLHPGSRGEDRRWPPALFARIATTCIKLGFRVVITGTSAEDFIAREVLLHIAPRQKPLVTLATGKTSLGAMAALLKQSCGLVSNCTGVSHVAAALKVRSVVISMDGEMNRWAPLNDALHKTVDWLAHPEYDHIEKLAAEMVLG